MRHLRLLLLALLGVAVLVPASAAQAADGVRPMVSGWYGWWLTSSDVADLASQNGGSIPEVNIFWWYFDGAQRPLCTYSEGGGCVTDSSAPWTQPDLDAQRRTLQAAGVKVFATITDLDNDRAGQLSAYLSTDDSRVAYARQITRWAQQAGVDGVDLDWENFAFNDGKPSWSTTRPRWVAMVKELSGRLHAAGLKLSATVPGGMYPFRSDGSPNPSGGYTVYDWPAITPYVDRLRIMAYDYHGSWSEPGPIGPNDWADQVIASAVDQVTRKYATRIWIGAPQYGRNWPLRNSSGSWATDATCPPGWKPSVTPIVTTPTPDQAWQIADREGITPSWDQDSAEWTFTYFLSVPGTADGRSVNCKVKRVVWFADTRSALARAHLVVDHQIGGIAVWSFDTVRTSFYPKMLEFATAHAPLATKVAIRAPKTLVKGTAGVVRVTVSTSQGVVPGARVTLRFTPDGASTSVLIGRANTDANGIVRFSVIPRKSGRWQATSRATWERLAGTSSTPRTVVTS